MERKGDDSLLAPERSAEVRLYPFTSSHVHHRAMTHTLACVLKPQPASSLAAAVQDALASELMRRMTAR
jgi:hypothetical protein